MTVPTKSGGGAGVAGTNGAKVCVVYGLIPEAGGAFGNEEARECRRETGTAPGAGPETTTRHLYTITFEAPQSHGRSCVSRGWGAAPEPEGVYSLVLAPAAMTASCVTLVVVILMKIFVQSGEKNEQPPL